MTLTSLKSLLKCASRRNRNKLDDNLDTKENDQYSADGVDDINRAANVIRSKTKHQPRIGIVCGSGLGSLCQRINDREVVPFSQVPGMPVSTVKGHNGNFVIGNLGSNSVIAMEGRIHFYEGYSIKQCIFPIRIMHAIGVEIVIITNAAGGLNADFYPGDIVMIKDHIFLPGFGGNSPLIGANDDRLGPRFVSMSNAYDKILRQDVMELARRKNLNLKNGVYAMVPGPQFETPSECLFLRNMGADLVGMSTVHEIIAARHCGMRVLAFSLVTNRCATDVDAEITAEDVHKEVLEVAMQKTAELTNFIQAAIENICDV